MELRPLGTTGLLVSAIGLGTVKLGRNRGVKYLAAYDLPTDAAAATLLDAAAGLGVNLLDTAPAYGRSEERLGGLLAAGAGGGRDRWAIITKAGEEFDADAGGDGGGKGGGEGSGEGGTDGVSRFDFSPGAVTGSVERSLRRLGTDRVECVLLHSDGRDEWVLRESGALGALERLKKAGKTRAIGISTKTVSGGLAAVGLGRSGAIEGVDVVMATYNPERTAEGVVIDAALAAGVGVLVKKALLSGRAAAGGGAAGAGGREGTWDAHTCVRFALSRAGVSSVVVGTLSVEHLRMNVEAAAGGG